MLLDDAGSNMHNNPWFIVAVVIVTAIVTSIGNYLIQRVQHSRESRSSEMAQLRSLYAMWVGGITKSGRAIRLIKQMADQRSDESIANKRGFAREYYEASESVTQLTWQIVLLEPSSSRRDRVLKAHHEFTQSDDASAGIMAASLLEELSESGDLRT